MKLLFKLKTFHYFWITAIYILITGYYIFIKLGDSALDINVHDTYFIIANQHVVFVLFSFYCLLGLLYFIFKNLNIQLNHYLTIIHTITTVGALFLYDIISLIVGHFFENSIVSNYDNNLDNLMFLLLALGAISQILFIFNLLHSSVRHHKKRHKS